MALKVISLGTVTVSTAGTAVQLSATHVGATSIVVQADQLNTDNIYLGDSSVDDTDIALAPGASMPLAGTDIRGITECLFLDEIYVDADTNGNAVRVMYYGRS